MRKFLFIGTLLAILLMTACGAKETEVTVIEEGVTDVPSIVETEPESEEVEVEAETPVTEEAPQEVFVGFETYNSARIVTYMESYGVKSEMVQIFDGDFSRMEMISDEGTVVFITNPELQQSYMIQVEEKTAIIMPFGDDDSDDPFMVEAEVYEAFDDEASIYDIYENIEVTTFRGEPVYYVEEEDTYGLVKIWISRRFGYPIRTEYWEEGVLVMFSEATIVSPYQADRSLFELPDDYEIISFPWGN